ncbi:DNA helicase [Tanacetum coccineum]
MKAGALFEIEAILNSNSRTMKDFGLPMPPRRLLDILKNRILMEEINYKRELLLKHKDALLPKLNGDQKLILDEVVNAVNNNQQRLIFVYGHDGTCNTFLRKSISCVLRPEERIVLAVASSGIELLFAKGTDLIIWDEAPMNDCRCFKDLDRCLRDILDNLHTFFGGKSIILGGYFRQTLPVKKKASKLEIIDASLTASYLWTRFKVYTFHQNMRLLQPEITKYEKQHVQRFSSWLLQISDGNIGESDGNRQQEFFNSANSKRIMHPRLGRRRYGVSVPALHKKPQRFEAIYAVFRRPIYAVKMDNPDITMEEYIELEAYKARRRGQTFNWEIATYGKVRYHEDIDYFKDFETDFPAIIFNDPLATDHKISSEPTVSPLDDNEIDFKISFDESYDEDYTVIYDKNSFSYKLIFVNYLKLDSKNDDNKVNIYVDDVVVEQSDSGIVANVDTQYHEFDEENHDTPVSRYGVSNLNGYGILI